MIPVGKLFHNRIDEEFARHLPTIGGKHQRMSATLTLGFLSVCP